MWINRIHVGIAALLLLWPPAPVWSDDTTQGRVLHIAAVDGYAMKGEAYLQRIAEYLEESLEPLGVERVDATFAESIDALGDLAEEHEIDWIVASYGGSLQLIHRLGYEPAQIIERNFDERQPTVFFTTTDSEVEALGDLRGRVLALETPSDSSSGFVPILTLVRAGFEVERARPRHTAASAPDRIAVAFAGSERNISHWVWRDLAAAGSFSVLDWQNRDELPDPIRPHLRIIEQTPPALRVVAIHRPGLDPALNAAITQALAAAGQHSRALRGLEATGVRAVAEPERAAILDDAQYAGRVAEVLR